MFTHTLPLVHEPFISVFARTDVGMHRCCNEDAFTVADLTAGTVGLGLKVRAHRVGERGTLLAVSDGMGGAAAGEVASRITVEAVREALMVLPVDMDIPARLRRAVEVANLRVYAYAREHPDHEGMGATVTAVVVHKSWAYVAQVGDSRAYLIRDKQVKQLTKDQTLVEHLIDSGAIGRDKQDLPIKNIITQAVGVQPEVKAVLTRVGLRWGDHLVVCSDGLSNKVAPQEMRAIIGDAPSLMAACRQMVELANERGGEDNITVVVARVETGALPRATTGRITGKFEVLG
ncbi:MAG TPA: PP2C family serine/threonine-protein phosphatase [Blastocatellia bacterium]|nr:PP2C family serine/threonine-protein phosphatase [Blastocatellia bacterium]